MSRGFDNIYKVFTRPHSTKQRSNSSHDMTKAMHDTIEFDEEFESDSLAERLQSENKRKKFTVIRKYDEEVDDTFLTRSCAVLLCYHRYSRICR